jgi:hypothetical protein
MSQDRSGEGHVRQVHLLLAVKCEVTEKLTSQALGGLLSFCFMELGSFTVEFFEHVPPPARESTLTLFSIRGASIERHTDRVFRVVCTEPRQLFFVGQRLFSPAFSRLCKVTAASGIAEVRASAYAATDDRWPV